MKHIIPSRLQGVLWSSDIDTLDEEKDKVYIIHQIFSHGRMEDILWLFTIYSKPEIEEVFTEHPYKDYGESRFYFIKKYLLALKEKQMNESFYVKNTPRYIREKS